MESTQDAGVDVLRFGVFELDGATGELRRNGSVIRLPRQPFQVLQLLAQNSGEVLDRDRIRREIWGETAVDFDRSLNVCIAQIRTALNDDADSPRFIQTLPRRGYRFLADVERVGAPAHAVATKPKAFVWAGVVLSLVAASLGTFWIVRTPNDPVIRLAVLPFANSAGNVQIDGLFDELLTRLGGIQPGRLRVIGRRSVERFRGDSISLREIGERLNAAYVLESSVRRQDQGLRLTLRLVQASSETVLLSQSFEQDGSPAEFEEQFVARASAGVLRTLFPDAPVAAQQEARCIDGWEAYRTGRLLANRATLSNLQKSIPWFEEAKCSASRAALAEVLTQLAKIGGADPDVWERARTAARQALGANSDVASAHVSLGNVAFWHDWDWKKADEEFLSALRLQPSDSHAHHDYAWLLMAVGRRQEAVASLRRAIALDPLSARINMHAGWLLLQAGRFQEAAAQARRTLELEPDSGEARACLSRALLYAGDPKGALSAIRPLIPEHEMNAVASLPASEAIWTLFKKSIRRKGAMDPYQRAWRLAWAGSRSEALDELDEALRSRSLMMPLVAVDPAFTSLRTDERFRKVVRDMRL